MLFRGRKIYYDVNTGERILEIGEGMGLIDTTVEQDIETFRVLSDRNRESFDFIQLEYGALLQDFIEASDYRVNVDTGELEFAYPDPSNPDNPPVYDRPLTIQLTEAKAEIAALRERDALMQNDQLFIMEILIENGIIQ